jgi:hypothetical protein
MAEKSKKIAKNVRLGKNAPIAHLIFQSSLYKMILTVDERIRKPPPKRRRLSLDTDALLKTAKPTI